MVIVWIGIGIGVLLAIVLIKKIRRTSSTTPFKLGFYCKKCGYKTNGLKCPKCENASSRQSWR
ncbi:MAG TPA: hypothetical protein VIG05_05230 [Candidatus Nitrosotenuis sp.]